MQFVPSIVEERRMVALKDAKSVSSKWPDLPADLLRLIYRKLYDTFDFINFRAVCKLWLAAAPLFEHPSQFPFILERETLHSSEFKLFSLVTGKTRRIQVPEACNKAFFGQSQGYLATFKTGANYTDTSELTLLNPFTRAEVPLPFHGFRCYRPLHVGADPIRNSDDVVIYMNTDIACRFVGFWNNEDNGWSLKGSFNIRAEAYNRGRLFFCNFVNSSITIFELTTGNKLEARLPYNNFRKHDFYSLGEGAAGAFLGIQRHFRPCPAEEYLSMEICWFEVYQLCEDPPSPCWVKLSDMSDLIIFLNEDTSGFCLPASDFEGIKGNSIYFIDWHPTDNTSKLIGLYELGNDSSQVIGQLDSEGTWIVPNVF